MGNHCLDRLVRDDVHCAAGGMTARTFRGTPRRVAAVVAVVLALTAATGARANGDPASDVLLEQPVFSGSALDLESKPAAQLDALVRDSARRGYPINVAVISRLQDLGSANYLSNDPDDYADS